jgi:hypothetical protein
MSEETDFRSPTWRKAAIASIYVLATVALTNQLWPAIMPMWLFVLGCVAVIAS